jgi:hypothetical protein
MKLLYSHDKNGIKISGEIESLIKAIHDGSSSRILLDDENGVQLATNAETLWIRKGIVYAQNSSHISVQFDKKDILKFKDDSYHWFIIVSSIGDRDMIRWKVGEHTLAATGHTHDKVAIKWFVD